MLGLQSQSEIVEQLRSDLEGLISELADLSHRNDELMTAKDSDLSVIQNLDAQLKDYKRKYEAAKTELRSLKGKLFISYFAFLAMRSDSVPATSQLFLPAPRSEADQLPVSPDGGLLDIHVTAFVSAIDSLLTAGRCPTPSRVLTPMKAVVNAVTAILDDVRAYERRRERSDIDVEPLRALRERAEATLSNLTAASKSHATSMGMSPVSLLDAAASHLAGTVTEIGKTILIRKAKNEDQPSFSSPSGSNGFVPSLRSIDEIKSSAGHQRSTSATSSRRGEEYISSSLAGRHADLASSGRGLQLASSDTLAQRRPASPSSSRGSSPPPIFDQTRTNANASDDSTGAEGPDEAWAELKVRTLD